MRKKKVQPAARTATQALMARAIGAHGAGRLDDAERLYRSILAAAPADVDALHYLGVLRHQRGDSDAALALIKRALALAPAYVEARNNLGNVQKEMGLAADAELSYRAVIELRPEFASAHNNLGVVLKTQGKHAEAAQAYRRCVALEPRFADGWTNLGNACRALSDNHGAMDAYYEAVKLAPQSAEAYRNLGSALALSGRRREALEVYRQWQTLHPDNPEIAHTIAAVEGGAAPERANDGYVQTTFDRFASTFDEVLAGLDYRAPALCGALLADVLGTGRGDLDVLDAGCGTGLCAPILQPYARTLDGVDLSPKMLEKAAARGGYRRLDAAELTAWLAERRADYDLIVSADTLCYFGALDDVAAAAASALRPGGHLVFTLEECVGADAPPFRLNPHGRYSHSETYARAALANAGLEMVALRRDVLRMESQAPVAGLVIAARSSPRS